MAFSLLARSPRLASAARPFRGLPERQRWLSSGGPFASPIRPQALASGERLTARPSSRLCTAASRLWRDALSEGNGARKIVGYWLLGASGLVCGIVTLGGLTRLTESGLSMVDWSVIHFSPPASQAEWQAYFEKYQQFPEYQLRNKGMSLEDFKRIYWMEHAHRVYGRLLGLFIALPATAFIAKRWVSPGMRNVLIGCCTLVGIQGLLGWHMVKSGLRKEITANGEEARVSPLRLTSHLGAAFVLYLITLAAGMRILTKAPPIMSSTVASLESKWASVAVAAKVGRLRRRTHQLAGFTLITALTGAMVAGLDAGMIYNTFPMMGSTLIPGDLWISKLGLANLVQNPTTVQFAHRCMAMSAIGGISALWLGARRLPLPHSARRALHLVMAAAWAQGSLGVLTLLYVVPIPLASAHQTCSLVLMGSFVWLMNVLKRLPK